MTIFRDLVQPWVDVLTGQALGTNEILRSQHKHDRPWPWPQRIPHKCPVCDGEGTRGKAIVGLSNRTTVSCHACNGTGIVWSKP